MWIVSIIGLGGRRDGCRQVKREAALGVGFVIFEADERERANVDLIFSLPSGWGTSSDGLKSLVCVASKRKPYWSHRRRRFA